jgi:shikimate kinase
MPVYDVDDDHLEKDWGTTVADKLKELGDEAFIREEGGKGNIYSIESTKKINKTNTIISLTGSNPLHEEAINHIRRCGILVYIDVNKHLILNNLHLMKVDRIVGQSTKSLSEILDYRKSIYEKYYDLRVIIDDEESFESIANRIVELLNRQQEYVSTRGNKGNFLFLDVIREGLAKDRGLFVPQYLPSFTLKQIKRLINLSYEERYM